MRGRRGSVIVFGPQAISATGKGPGEEKSRCIARWRAVVRRHGHMQLSKEALRGVIKEGAVTDIFKADRAYALLMVIGEHADWINASKKNFGELFGVVQSIAQTEALISVARLYDRPSTQYATRCLNALLDELEAQADALPPIVEKWNLAEQLTRLGMPDDAVARMDSASDGDLTRMMIAFLRDRMKQPSVVAAIRRVRTVRNKRIAHNEAVHSLRGPTWSAVLELLTLAKEIVGAVGWAYLGIAYMNDGTYLPSSDAERPARAMRRLLRTLGIVPR